MVYNVMNQNHALLIVVIATAEMDKITWEAIAKFKD